MKAKQAFMKLFNSFSAKHNRYTLFSDFVTMAAISLHNAVNMNETLEAEYMAIVGKYSKEELDCFCQLMARTVEALDERMHDFLGDVYMELEISSKRAGQFFTPYHLSKMMGQMMCPKSDISGKIESQGFVMLSEPACGAAGMVVGFAESMIEENINYQETLWVQAIDVDSTCTMMAYLQMAILGIPGEVITGNTLTLEVQRVMKTPFHYFGGWDFKIKMKNSISQTQSIVRELKENKNPVPVTGVPTSEMNQPTVVEQSCFDF